MPWVLSRATKSWSKCFQQMPHKHNSLSASSGKCQNEVKIGTYIILVWQISCLRCKPYLDVFVLSLCKHFWKQRGTVKRLVRSCRMRCKQKIKTVFSGLIWGTFLFCFCFSVFALHRGHTKFSKLLTKHHTQSQYFRGLCEERCHLWSVTWWSSRISLSACP